MAFSGNQRSAFDIAEDGAQRNIPKSEIDELSKTSGTNLKAYLPSA